MTQIIIYITMPQKATSSWDLSGAPLALGGVAGARDACAAPPSRRASCAIPASHSAKAVSPSRPSARAGRWPSWRFFILKPRVAPWPTRPVAPRLGLGRGPAQDVFLPEGRPGSGVSFPF